MQLGGRSENEKERRGVMGQTGKSVDVKGNTKNGELVVDEKKRGFERIDRINGKCKHSLLNGRRNQYNRANHAEGCYPCDTECCCCVAPSLFE